MNETGILIVLEVIMVFLEAAIVWILIDDVYGLTEIRKHSKRRLRKFNRQFWKATKKYFKMA